MPNASEFDPLISIQMALYFFILPVENVNY